MRSSREAEIAQGLREPGGALIGGLVVEDYTQGWEDFENGVSPPKFTSTSYDLGRNRAREKKEIADSVMREIDAEQEAGHQRVRAFLADKPGALAEYEAKIAAIRS